MEDITEHTTDADCAPFLDPTTLCCAACGAVHGDPCGECGGTGYHNAGRSDVHDAFAASMESLRRDSRELGELMSELAGKKVASDG